MIKLFQVDAFTDTLFKGNPAGVCILEKMESDQWMLLLAREMNLSETAFLVRQDNDFYLKWFTPKKEVLLCGHATLASAHVLWEEKIVSYQDNITFLTKSGKLSARKDHQIIRMDFPSRIVMNTDQNEKLNQFLKVKPLYTGKYGTNSGDIFLLEVESDEIVKNLKPDFQGLLSTQVRSVIVTSKSSDPKYDFVSRYFAPAVGVNEDPVTGSAHCCLAPYWGEKLGKKGMVGYQASERSGIVLCTWNNDRVILGGTAVTVFKIRVLL